MLAAQVHIGTHNKDCKMREYIFRRRMDGISILNLGHTWDKIQLAVRIIVCIENAARCTWVDFTGSPAK